MNRGILALLQQYRVVETHTAVVPRGMWYAGVGVDCCHVQESRAATWPFKPSTYQHIYIYRVTLQITTPPVTNRILETHRGTHKRKRWLWKNLDIETHASHGIRTLWYLWSYDTHLSRKAALKAYLVRLKTLSNNITRVISYGGTMSTCHDIVPVLYATTLGVLANILCHT